MFTGIIAEIGEIVVWRRTSTGLALSVRAPELAAAVAPGESVAVNGMCLTVEAAPQNELLAFHIGQESVARTTATGWTVGLRVNLERALAAGDRLGGHFVSGHVDATGPVASIRREGETVWLSVGFPPEARAYLVEKGSVAVDGVSLTIARLAERELSLAVIPYTWDHTALASLRAGTLVNLEYDMLGKYVINFLRQQSGAPSGLTEEFLRDQGFM